MRLFCTEQERSLSDGGDDDGVSEFGKQDDGVIVSPVQTGAGRKQDGLFEDSEVEVVEGCEMARNRRKAENKNWRDMVRVHVWPKFKFMASAFLKVDHPTMELLCQMTGKMTKKEQEKCLEMCGGVITEAINDKRATVVCEMKRVFMGELQNCMKGGTETAHEN